jgi:hypothetical protein
MSNGERGMYVQVGVVCLWHFFCAIRMLTFDLVGVNGTMACNRI